VPDVKVPLPHAEQDLEPESDSARPWGHDVHAVAASLGMKDPAPHAVHTVCPPVAPVYRPTGHGKHCARPGKGAKRPAGQLPHVFEVDATVAEKVPGEHGVHVVMPLFSFHVPAGHCLHGTALVAPGTSEKVPAGHAGHPPLRTPE
jgi:hypothetical protein